MANRVGIFIDGAYLDRLLHDEFRGARVDYRRLSERMAGSAIVLRTHYYDCPLYQEATATLEQRRRYSTQRRFFEALERLPRYTVRLGRLERRGADERGNPRYVQKRVDILLGLDLALLAAKGRIQEAAILAGDSDFIPAIDVAKREGVVVRVFHGQNLHSELWREADERTRITQEIIDAIRWG